MAEQFERVLRDLKSKQKKAVLKAVEEIDRKLFPSQVHPHEEVVIKRLDVMQFFT